MTSEAIRFSSTRDAASSIPFSEALVRGLAPDGGLYVPQRWPALDPARIEPPGFSLPPAALAQVGKSLIAPFTAGDALAPQVEAVVREAFDFPAPLVPLTERTGPGKALRDSGDDDRLCVLELFHGPTAAFKDFGARFLAACLARLRKAGDRPLKILVATSGDTGGAVAAAFHQRQGIEVAVLFPEGLVSPTQEWQLTCWGGNVRSLAVRGTFDDCQRLVKQAFMDAALREEFALSSANSINLGRLLPQCVYYAASSLAVRHRYGEPASYVIPSGNLGNSAACLWARALGFPIDRIVLAHNANRAVPDYLRTSQWEPRASIATLASAMDVGNPSNMERLKHLFPDASSLSTAVSAETVDDDAIRARIRAGFERFGQVWCPHTAVAAEAYERLPESARRSGRWILVATAHPAKFREIVEPIVGAPVETPRSLEALFARPVSCDRIDADLGALRSILRQRTWT